jgi:ribonuclease P protein component
VKRFSFPKSRRLVSNRQFKAVLLRGVRVSDGLLVLYMAGNECGCRRLGISVGKSSGGAVVRNRLKRLIREAFRQSQGLPPMGCDCVVMISPRRLKKGGEADAEKGAGRVTLEQIKSSLLSLVISAVEKIKSQGFSDFESNSGE